MRSDRAQLKRIAGEIKAEIARQDHKVIELTGVLALSKNAIYRRNEGLIAYHADELHKIAEWLGVPVAQFYKRPPKQAVERKQ